MNYVYYRDPKGNFGDDLNGWLWPQLFGEGKDEDQDVFLGIGSILFNGSPLFRELTAQRKIVFGTGVRPVYKTFHLDSSWDIRFLRGPLSAYAFNNQFPYVADAAYAIRQLPDFERLLHVPKKYKVSVIPYFKSVPFFNWESICYRLGFNYISPRSEQGVEHTLKEIAASEYVIAEAMHGAILADALRVPWHRFVLSTPHTEGSGVSEFKWMDWQAAIQLYNIDATQVKLYRKSFLHQKIKSLSGNRISAEFLAPDMVKSDLLKALQGIAEFYLSAEEVLRRIDYKIHDQVALLQKEQRIDTSSFITTH
ncbi:polysaccharide pyruvyl transferase family protein [Chitinophaga polysaccharea]|uniref:polysaccharide pyruvyl transferase family protein n=1 Tax=Chitinophaga TaxID=79328 RepID=UPI001455880E|nr:polysaccharide pyruvyl transferase family protein [Chitinophaga sp. Ak27]NLR60546.1 polysaccharide pyruvyl transferase family protein [Chitinophaga polysaccharea]NLU90515.1 polysaccharide pyruvyl transferase family protein [Chitinophaga sp. Ak27]